LSPDEIEKYLSRTFSIECPRILLRQNAHTNPRTYQGPGAIRQIGDQLEFKLYSQGQPDITPLLSILGPKAIRAGEKIPREEYFSLEATDLSGSVWTSEFILPDLHQGIDHGPIIFGSLRNLSNKTSGAHIADRTSGLTLVFAEEFSFPPNIPIATREMLGNELISHSMHYGAAQFSVLNFEFQLRRHVNTLILAARSKVDPLPQYFDDRICEALEFVLSASAAWVISPQTPMKEHRAEHGASNERQNIRKHQRP